MTGGLGLGGLGPASLLARASSRAAVLSLIVASTRTSSSCASSPRRSLRRERLVSFTDGRSRIAVMSRPTRGCLRAISRRRRRRSALDSAHISQQTEQ